MAVRLPYRVGNDRDCEGILMIKTKSTKAFGIASLVLSVSGLACLICCIIVLTQISIFGLCFSFGCAVFSVTALVFGAVSLKKQKSHNPIALTGFIISIVTIALLILLLTLITAIVVFFSYAMDWLAGIGRMG